MPNDDIGTGLEVPNEAFDELDENPSLFEDDEPVDTMANTSGLLVRLLLLLLLFGFLFLFPLEQ